MSHFIREFDTLVKDHTELSGSKVWEIAGLDRSMLSRIRAADARQSNIQFSEIPRVAAAIGKDEMIFLRLLRARLLDECTDSRADRIRIEISGSRFAGGPLPSALRDIPLMPPQIEDALMNLINGMEEDTGLRNHILWLGNDVFAPAAPSSGSKVDKSRKGQGDTEQLDKGVLAAIKRDRDKRQKSGQE